MSIDLHEADEFGSVLADSRQLVFAYLEGERYGLANLNGWDFIGCTCLVVFETEGELAFIAVGGQGQDAVMASAFDTNEGRGIRSTYRLPRAKDDDVVRHLYAGVFCGFQKCG